MNHYTHDFYSFNEIRQQYLLTHEHEPQLFGFESLLIIHGSYSIIPIQTQFCYTQRRMPTVISSVCWVPKGVAQSNPDRLKLDDTQIQELMQQQQDDSMDDVTEDTQGTATAGGNVVYLSSR